MNNKNNILKATNALLKQFKIEITHKNKNTEQEGGISEGIINETKSLHQVVGWQQKGTDIFPWGVSSRLLLP